MMIMLLSEESGPIATLEISNYLWLHDIYEFKSNSWHVGKCLPVQISWDGHCETSWSRMTTPFNFTGIAKH